MNRDLEVPPEGLNYPAMRQDNPHKLMKIEFNIRDLEEVLKPEDELLDAGCCEGHLYDRLEHKKYTGVDIVPENIQAAKLRNPTVRYEVGNILELTEKWDVIFCCRVLMHLPNYLENVEKLRKIARRKLVVVIPMSGRYTDRDDQHGGIQFRSYVPSEVGETERIIKRPKFSTVIYGGSGA